MNNLRNGIKHPQQISMLIDENEALKKELMEANAKVERLTSAMVQTDYECRLIFNHQEPYETLLSQAMKESPAQSLALHDADVIDKSCSVTDEDIEEFTSMYKPELYKPLKIGAQWMQRIISYKAYELRDNANKSEGE